MLEVGAPQKSNLGPHLRRLGGYQLEWVESSNNAFSYMSIPHPEGLKFTDGSTDTIERRGQLDTVTEFQLQSFSFKVSAQEL